MSPLRAVALLPFLLLSTSALAAPPLTFSLGHEMRVLTQRSYDLVDSDDHFPTVRLGVGSVRQVARGSLDLEAAYHAGSTEALVHDSLRSRLTLSGFELAAGYRHSLYRRFQPFARIFVSYDWARLSIDEENGWSQRRGGIGAGALLGVSVPVWLQERAGRDSARMSVDLGLGYGLRQSGGFHALQRSTESALDDEEPVTDGSLDMGNLGLSAPQYRLGVTFRL